MNSILENYMRLSGKGVETDYTWNAEFFDKIIHDFATRGSLNIFFHCGYRCHCGYDLQCSGGAKNYQTLVKMSYYDIENEDRSQHFIVAIESGLLEGEKHSPTNTFLSNHTSLKLFRSGRLEATTLAR